MERVEFNGIPEKVKAKVAEVDAEARVILFGSRARGDHKSDSDWDFLIITRQKVSPSIYNKIGALLYDIELDAEQIISYIIENEDTWHKYQESELYKYVKEEGIEVFVSKAA